MIDDLKSVIQEYTRNNETGRLEIRNFQKIEKPWSLYFALGRLIWAGGGEHPIRRLYRKIKKQFPEQSRKELEISSEGLDVEAHSIDYDLLGNFLQKKDEKGVQALINIKHEVIVEVLFDIFQVLTVQSRGSSEYSVVSGVQWEWFPKVRPNKYIHIPPDLDECHSEIITVVEKQWGNWEKAGFKFCLPNQAPEMDDPESIRKTTAAKTFENLKQLLDGKQTLREIAATTQRDLIPITKVLWGYYQKGWLSFKEVSDWNLNLSTIDNSASSSENISFSSTISKPESKFVVACVDDSPQVTQTLETILRSEGYDFVGINDPLRANATLLKLKPNLIFLDLIMPNTNGYEICTQLRRVSSLQEIPIIILTGKDGLIDRMRAKMVGATEYLSKPVQPQEILEAVQKYLPNFNSQIEKTSSQSSL